MAVAAGKGLPCQRKSLAAFGNGQTETTTTTTTPPSHKLTNLQGALKIEEVASVVAEELKSRRQQQALETPKRVGLNLGSPMLTNRNVVTPPPPQVKVVSKVGATPGYLVDVTKKGSTSTIWTSEESILRSVGAVDEDNK